MSDVSFSTMGFADFDLQSTLNVIAGAGFDAIELATITHGPETYTASAATEMRRQIEKRDLRATTIHAPMGENALAVPDERWRKDKIKVMADSLRFAGDLGAAGMVVHTILNPRLLPPGDIKSQIDFMRDSAPRSVEALVAVAAEANVRILLENLPYKIDPPYVYPLISMAQLREFVEPYPAEQVGLVVDVGHAWTAGIDPVAEIETAGDRLWGTHLQDVDADQPSDNHWIPTHGGLNWRAICEALLRINYAGAWTFEVVNERHGESQEQLAIQSRAVAAEWGL